MEPDRRQFLAALAAGTAGLAVGGAAGPEFPFFAAASRYNVGDYLPKDQGGKFVQMAVIGSEADEAVVAAVRNGVLQRDFGDPIGWNRLEKQQLERSVWLNRFYYLPSFARLYHLTGDRRLLDDMMAIVVRWIADNPRSQASTSPSIHNWRDMQVAWRSIHLSWCYYLGGHGLTGGERSSIIRTLQEHAHVLLAGFGRQPLNEFNHQAHGALAMLYLGTLFPSLDGAPALRQTALAILSHHLDRAFYEDGGNVEQMFGYYPFEAHIFRDTFLLCSANGLAPPPRLRLLLNKMASFLSAVAQPDGTLPPVNDSYEMPLQPTLDTITEVLPDRAGGTPVESRYFPDARIAVLRDRPLRRWYVLGNAARTIGSHAHAGRLAVNVWYDGTPILVDSGCCTYDDPALVTWFRTTRAHNTVMVDGRSDAATSSAALWAPKRETANRITHWDVTDALVCCTMSSPAEDATNAGVAWTRTVVLVRDDLLVIHDALVGAGSHEYQTLFHFPPGEVLVDHPARSVQVGGDAGPYLLPAEPTSIDSVSLDQQPVSVRGVSTPAPMATYTFRRTGNADVFFGIIPSAPEGRPVLSTQSTGDGILLTVSGGRGGTTRLLFAAGRVRVV